MANDNKTEQPTDRRRAKAREKGQVARSRDLSAAVATAVALGWLFTRDIGDLWQWRIFFRSVLQDSLHSESAVPAEWLQQTLAFAFRWMLLPLLALWGAAVLS